MTIDLTLCVRSLFSTKEQLNKPKDLHEVLDQSNP
ncbi:MAG: hypothetical protein ACJAVN_000590 [Roseivirga sp.]|jgi:hypothetical protein